MRRETVLREYFSLRLDQNFYDSLAINSYVYELIGELIIITCPRVTDSNKFRSPAEIETVIISRSLIFNVANEKSCANYHKWMQRSLVIVQFEPSPEL